MGGKRIRGVKLRAVLAALPEEFDAGAFEQACRAHRVSFDQAQRRLMADGLAELVSALRSGKRGRPRHVYRKIKEASGGS